jgi:hypothetical protein
VLLVSPPRPRISAILASFGGGWGWLVFEDLDWGKPLVVGSGHDIDDAASAGFLLEGDSGKISWGRGAVHRPPSSSPTRPRRR